MLHLVGKATLHGFLWPFTFKLHFQYGRRRPSWILMVGLVKIQIRCQNGFSMPKLVVKVVLHTFRYQFVFKFHFQYAIGGHFEFWLLTTSAAIFARVMRAIFFNKYLKELKSSVKPYYALSGHGNPGLHPTSWWWTTVQMRRWMVRGIFIDH